MTAPESLITELMLRVRCELYANRPAKQWYQQQDTVKKALTLPAAWLEERKVPMSPARYREIVGGILDTIRDNRQAQRLAYPSAYLLKCVQEHMDHHGDEYYQEGKSARNRITLDMAALERAAASHRPTAISNVIPVFSQVHAALSAGKSKGRPKAVAATSQPNLL